MPKIIDMPRIIDDSRIFAEYIWIDGTKPTKKLRSKTKVMHVNGHFEEDNLPYWGFDGSSTEQALGSNSDCILVPVRVIIDPLRGHPHRLVLCEVLNSDGAPHHTNTRRRTAKLQEKSARHECLFGIEQEYTLYHGSRHAGDAGIPLGWPERGPANPQGKYYCGVGADEVKGREIYEEHLFACLGKYGDGEIPISGGNAEVMPGQFEFQIGPADALDVCDYLWLARYILYRIAEKHQITVKLDPKPLAGDWNGAGAHINFSTCNMRVDPKHCEIACQLLMHRFSKEGFPEIYGAGYEKRLTGKHETCSYKEFKYGEKDRTASVRIPIDLKENEDGSKSIVRKGYIEDRRPCANVDPYEAVSYLMETVCR
jgi:glutamine synthetase